MINILEYIIKQRELRGWTEYTLSEKAELPQSTISSWYKKNMLPSLTSLDKICNAFGMSMAQFLAGEDEIYPLTVEQKELIDNWSHLNPEQKKSILQLLKVMH